MKELWRLLLRTSPLIVVALSSVGVEFKENHILHHEVDWTGKGKERGGCSRHGGGGER